MSGFARASVVVEAGNKSGARMQARLAIEQGRPVFLLRSLLRHQWAQTTQSSGHAQSAAHVLTAAGAQKVGLVVIGRHVRRNYEPVQGSGESCGDILDALPETFDWTTCAAHATERRLALGHLAPGVPETG
jgi:DNA recombination-mediator protein A